MKLRLPSVAFTGVAMALAPICAADAPLPTRPNIIFILSDDQGYGDVSAHGNPVLKTPNLDRLHDEGVRFDDFHVSPTCSPSRSTLITGRHEFRNGVTHTIYERERLTLKATTLAQVLKSAGYTTGIFGKWHLGDEDAYQPDQRGFDEVFIHGGGGIGQTYPGSCGDAPGNSYFSPTLKHNGRFEKTDGYCTDVFFAQAMKWIEAVKGKCPFYAYIATNVPHEPLQVRPEDEARYAGKVPAKVAKFFGMLANLDDNVGRLLAKLAEWGVERDTLIVFMNDNGGTAGCRFYNAGMRGTKGTAWLGGTRASSFWRWPGTLKPATVDKLAGAADFFPTVAEIAGATLTDDVKRQVEGRSLVPLLLDTSAAWSDRVLFTHLGRWPHGEAAGYKYTTCSVRAPRWHLVSAAKQGGEKKWQLFDVKADIGESNDVAAQHPDVVKELDAAYDKWWDSVQPQLVNENAVGPEINPFKALYWKQFGGGPDTAPRADMIFTDGRIVTLDSHDRVAEAMAVRDGRIVAVGSNAETLKLAGGRTEIIKLDGKTVLPGFVESHVHSIGVARASVTETYAELSSIAEIQDWIRRRAREVPPGQWIEVPRNDLTRLKERRHPTPAELDAATTDHPVLYTGAMKHALNSAGFRALGIVDASSKLPDGEIVRDEQGRPVLIRGGNQTLRKLMPQPTVTREQTMEALSKLLRRYSEVGITTIHERATDRDGVGMYRELREQGRLTTRMRGTFRFSAKTAEGVEKYIKALGFKPGEGDDWVRAVMMKTTVDGGIHWGTTRLSEPYGERRIRFYRLTDPNYRGELYDTPEELKTVFATVNRLGWPMCVHVTGDGGTEIVLDAVAAVAATDPSIKQRRFTLLHTYFPTPAIARRAKELGVGVDTQGYLYYRDTEAMAEVYGKSWAERFIGLGEWVNAGVPVAVNSDHMIGFDPDHAMNAFNPALMLWIAVARQTDRGRVYGVEQKLTRFDALRAVTLWPAWLSFDEDKLGSLEPGKLADLVVIDRDYLTCPLKELREIKVLRTMVGGKTVFQRGKQ